MSAAAATITLSLLLFSFLPSTTSNSIGINYGRIGNNLPPPPKVIDLLKSHNLTRIKLFDTDSSVLTALSNSNINVVVSLPNELLPFVAASQIFADLYVESNISAFFPATNITAIAVGNEVFANPNNITQFLVPSMNNIYNSLIKFKLESFIKLSSPIALSALEISYPSSSGSFKPSLIEPVIKPLLEFLRQTGSSLMVNAYPFFPYSSNPDLIPLDYALMNENPGVVDPGNGLQYRTLFDAQIDAVYAAMSALQYDDVKIVVTETGWPSKGDDNEIGAGAENAAAYNGNLVRRVLTGKGTPLRANDPLDVYLFALFNENEKIGPTSERNYGLFYPDERKVYNVPLLCKIWKMVYSGDPTGDLSEYYGG